MTATERQDHWAKVYATKGEAEVSWFQPVPQVSLDLIARAGIAKDAAFIDIGAGASRLQIDGGYRPLFPFPYPTQQRMAPQ